MNPKSEIKMLLEMCKDCGWYNDCPLNYKCPPMEIIIKILEEGEDD